MIDKALKVLVDGLNRHLATRYNATGPLALLAPPPAAGDPHQQAAADRILVTLVNLERESAARSAAQAYRPEGGGYLRGAPPLSLNMVVMISANFPQNYADGVAVLSGVLGYFQARPVLDATNTPDLPAGLHRLTVEWKDADLAAMNNLWTVLGGRYQPSALYLVRMLVVDSGDIGDDVAAITRVDLDDETK